MSHKTRIVTIIGLLVVIGVFLAVSRAVTAAPAPVEPPQTQPTGQPTPEIPFFALWQKSGHNKADAPAFTHWNGTADAPGKEVEIACAKCHSTPGFQDFVGADGSKAGSVEKAPPIGTTVTCTACHNAATVAMTSVTFPSGAEVTGLGREAVCMTCHQGAAAGTTVDEAIKKLNITDEDKPMPNTAAQGQPSNGLGFTNIHYFAAAVTRYGTLAKGGYEYPGKQYDALFDHVSTVSKCQDCHNPHSLELETQKCATCHTGATTVDGVRKIRMESSLVDYDGDGNVTEPIRDEISGVRNLLLTAMQSYAKDVLKSPIAYSPDAYPYFFVDKNGNNAADKDEAVFPNAYGQWSARLLKAAYNYQTSVKDPGAYAHGGKYIIELLYDSIEDLNTKLATKVDLAKAHRVDAGHFAGSEMAFRDWDAEGEVPAGCSKCHSGMGLAQFISQGTNVANPIANGLMCEACHNDVAKFTRFEVAKVPFPSGAQLTFGEKNDANLCLECHQGRESTVSVNRVVSGKDADAADPALSFRNVHYFAAGATLFGTEAKGMYEYKDQKYAGQFKHPAPADTCIGCHDAHALAPKTDTCKGCHANAATPEDIRMTTAGDFDGDGNATEGLKGEIDTMAEKLYAAIQAYAKTKLNTPIAYSASSYPYFFADKNSNGKVDTDEAVRDNGFKGWSPRLLEAAYNYQYVQKDPGAFVHNGKYVIQVLYDAIKDVGGDVSKMSRPQ